MALRSFALNPLFALADLFLVSLSAFLWILRPQIGVLPIIAIALIPWLVRSLAGVFPFKRTILDWLVAIFVATAWIGYWAAYNKEAAWGKLWLIILAALLYYALAGQPSENFDRVSLYFFCVGVGVSLYFFLTHDFVAFPRRVESVNRVGRWIMEFRPQLDWTPIHPNYVAGIAVIMTPFVLYPAGRLDEKNKSTLFLVRVFAILGLAAALLAIFMATSRSVFLAIAVVGGLWIVWRVIIVKESRLRLRWEAIFPWFVIICLLGTIAFLYAGPANLGYSFSPDYPYGTGSRGELFARSLDIVSDFPFTGGGLDAFPGLYSYYVLEIPFFSFANSHNLFLDVAIEQGLLGAASFLMIYLISIWLAARAIAKKDSLQPGIFRWLTFCGLIFAFVHGMVNDYLYNGNGTLLSLAMVGLTVTMQPESARIVRRPDYRAPGLLALAVITVFMLNLNRIRSAWYSDLGAVQMERLVLAGFPTNQWTEPSILPRVRSAQALFQNALQADPTNRTANYRLGLISMLEADFQSAALYLEKAHKSAPNHRGITKSLGYCYVWLGDMERAHFILTQIPEATEELDAYVWWWSEHGRPDLAKKASSILSRLE